MLSHATPIAAMPLMTLPDADANQRATQHIADTLKLLSAKLAPQRHLVHAGEVLYQAGERFDNLYIMNSGFFKIVTLSPDGREQVVGLKFRGDWLASTASRAAAIRATRSRWTPARSG